MRKSNKQAETLVHVSNLKVIKFKSPHQWQIFVQFVYILYTCPRECFQWELSEIGVDFHLTEV